MKKFLLLITLVSSLSAFSQQWAWARQASLTTGHQKAKDVCADQMGNVFIIGENQDTAYYGGTILDSGSFVAKYNSSGTLLWAKKLPGDAIDVACDAAGNLCAAGNFTGNISLGSFLLVSNGLIDIYITKINAYGNVVTAQSFGGPKNDLITAMAIDRSNNIFLTGSYQDSITFNGLKLIDSQTNKYYDQLFYVVKLSPSWLTVWAKTCPYNYAGNLYQYQSTSYLTVDKNGAAYITGEYFTLPCYGYCNGHFIMKYDSTGSIKLNNRIWDTYSFPLGLSVDDSLNILVEYHTGSHYTSALGLSKYDSVMTLKWHLPMGAYQYGTNYTFCSGLSVDKQCNIYLAGLFGFINTDPSDTTLNFCSQIIQSKGETDAIIGKFSPSGNCVWVKSAGGKGAEDYYATGQLYVNKTGDCFLTGNYHVNIQYVSQVLNESVIFDIDTLHNDGSWQQIYLAKINSYNPTPTSLNETKNELSFQVFPNPTSGLITTSMSLPNIHTSIRIKDVFGKTVLNEKNARHETQLDLRFLPKGVYFLEGETEKGKLVKKIILQ